MSVTNQEARIAQPFIFSACETKIRIMEIVTVNLIKMQEGGGLRAERKGNDVHVVFSHSEKALINSRFSTLYMSHLSIVSGSSILVIDETEQFGKRLISWYAKKASCKYGMIFSFLLADYCMY